MSLLKKTWNFLWHSNSIMSWIIDLVLIFIIVKFIIFPFFSFVLTTSLPFVIIESGSLEHKITSHNSGIMPNICGFTFVEKKSLKNDFSEYWRLCGKWYEDKNITKEEFIKWTYVNGLDKGDIIIVKGMKTEQYKKGDIIIFNSLMQKTPIIHRIIDIKKEGDEIVFSTKGDHNEEQLPYENNIKKEQIVGKAVLRIPMLGWVKLFVFNIFG